MIGDSRRTAGIKAFVACCCLALAPGAFAWDAHGHRMITRVALASLPDEYPAWLKDEDSILMATEQCTTPDRWRSVTTPQLKHLNEPDHYIDVEDLEVLGLTLETVPILRNEFIKAVVLARAKPDFKGPPIPDTKDPVKVQEYPGFLPHATIETWAKLVSAFKTIRSIDALGDPTLAPKTDAAQWNARYQIGILSHWVGDTAQPLHTTKHHHGWVGENPNQYTTDRNFHRYIDGEILDIHDIKDSDIAEKLDPARVVNSDAVWDETLLHIRRSFDKVEPLYQVQKSGALQKDEGKAFIVERLADASSQLAALVRAAWIASAPTPKDIKDFPMYDAGDKPKEGVSVPIDAKK